MKQRNLGHSGLLVSVVGLGCNNFGGRIDAEASRLVIDKAIDSGITLFDTADVYGNRGGSETILGSVLGAKRNKIVLATKFGMNMDDQEFLRGASRRYVVSAVEASLQRLQTDWIDLYQLHAPDAKTPMEETLRALEDLIRQGKVRYVGCSNVPAWQVADAQWIAKSLGINGFVSCQDHYSLLVRDVEKELVPMTKQFGLGLLPYFPLASGMLSGKYRRDHIPDGGRLSGNSTRHSEMFLTDKNFGIVERLEAYAKDHGYTLLQLAMSWLASQPTVSSVIAGATKTEQIDMNVTGADWEMTPEQLADIEKLMTE